MVLVFDVNSAAYCCLSGHTEREEEEEQEEVVSNLEKTEDEPMCEATSVCSKSRERKTSDLHCACDVIALR